MRPSLMSGRQATRRQGGVPGGVRRLLGRARHVGDEAAFAPLLDAKAASRLLGVPPTWLLAQARAGRVAHHRLGHYVRFSAEDLREWLSTNRIAAGRNGSSDRRFAR